MGRFPLPSPAASSPCVPCYLLSTGVVCTMLHDATLAARKCPGSTVAPTAARELLLVAAACAAGFVDMDPLILARDAIWGLL